MYLLDICYNAYANYVGACYANPDSEASAGRAWPAQRCKQIFEPHPAVLSEFQTKLHILQKI